MTRRLAAILAADVVGYARAVEADEAAALGRLRTLRESVVEPLLAEHHGRLVKTMGDGLIAEFGSVVDAVGCAVALQARLAADQAAIAPERRTVLRVGVDLGDVVVDGDDLLGDGVNVAARLEQLCEPGGVLVSGSAYDQLHGKLDLPLVAAGERRLKNIERPVRVYRLAARGPSPPPAATRRPRRGPVAALVAALLLAIAAGAAWWYRPPTAPVAARGRPAVAVLPFADLAGDDASRRLAAGITEDIITDLSRFNEFDVMARNATLGYAGAAVDVRKVGADLGVGYVLEGSVQRDADRVRVTAQLIETDGLTHLWSKRWDRPAGEVFAVQSEIAEEVAGQLGGFGVIERAEQRKVRQNRPGSLSAYDLMRRAQEVADGHTRADVEAAMRLLEQAVAADPDFAQAWVQLAAMQDHSTSFGLPWDEMEKAALASAQRAVRLDPRNAEAHAVLGHILGNLGEFERAAAEFDTALDLNPGSAVILTKYSGWASTFGQPERGAEAADHAIRLDPNYPIWAVNFYRWAYFMAGRFEDAWRVQERQPVDRLTDWGFVMRAAILGALGRSEEAQRAVADALAHDPTSSIQGFVSDPGMSDEERRKLIEALRKAGFPACAGPEALATLKDPFPLPECAVAAKG